MFNDSTASEFVEARKAGAAAHDVEHERRPISEHPGLPKRMMDGLGQANEILVVAAAAIDVIVTFASAVARYTMGRDFPWSPELSTILLAIIAFPGAAAYYRTGTGMAYTAVVDAVSGQVEQVIRATGHWITIFVCIASLLRFPVFLQQQQVQVLPVLGISVAWSSIWLGIGLGLIILYGIEKLLTLTKAGIAGGLIAVLILIALLFSLKQLYNSDDFDFSPFYVVIPALLVAFMCGTPIALVLGLGGMVYVFLTDVLPQVAIPASYQAGIGSYILLSIPFFMLAGTLMEVTGMARRLIDMVQEWVGHWRGGLLLAEVVAMYIFSDISGSKSADVATVGTVMKEPLRKFGYPPTESVAVLAASAAMGATIPPSLGLLILGSITSLSVGSLFMAGILPAAVMAVVLMIAILVRSQQHQWHKGPPFSLRRAAGSVPPAIPALMVPVIVIGGIMGGITSPTEASSFAVVYGFLAALVVYRSIGFRSSWGALRHSALTAGMILFMIATANLLSQVIVIDGLARQLDTVFADFESRSAFLFVSMFAVIVIGFVLEGYPAILITAPILLPVAERMGVDPLQFGILLTLAVGIGVFMPPIGIGYYICCAIGEAPVNATMRPSALYNVILLIGFSILILFPQITVFLPHLLGMR